MARHVHPSGDSGASREPRAADRHPVDQLMPVGPMFVYGLQHVMSMYAGVIAVP